MIDTNSSSSQSVTNQNFAASSNGASTATLPAGQEYSPLATSLIDSLLNTATAAVNSQILLGSPGQTSSAVNGIQSNIGTSSGPITGGVTTGSSSSNNLVAGATSPGVSTTTFSSSSTTSTSTTTTTTTTTTPPTCASGAYTISKSLTTWESARLDCNRMGKDLVNLETQAEEQCFLEYVRNQSRIGDRFWIGLNAIRKTSFQWTNDQDPGFTSWDQDFPGGGAQEYCVQMVNGKWQNKRCTDLSYFACENSTTINTTSKSCPATSSTYMLTKDIK
ncbi:macrophage mannose receptor 1-like [Neocloeon triangulifer]|uniref:macrophage mannose receptor 1-like n=1 Tax=Neocloeon triangulifer TaxID=2078957 RepID=UPI00286F5A9A|nr:macrophage mannose receptor 1-like [Neocloeon triangulifer]